MNAPMSAYGLASGPSALEAEKRELVVAAALVKPFGHEAPISAIAGRETAM